MNGPTWADVGNRRKQIESRDVVMAGAWFSCPFCECAARPSRLLQKVTGHRCTCGALFYTQQPVAVHFKERDECPN